MAMSAIEVCGDCGRRTTVMLVLRSPRGAWALCSSCWCASAREAEVDRKEHEVKLAKKERSHR